MNFTGIKARMLRRSGLALCVALAALSGCGGGSRKVDFVPTRIVAFGDESSVIVAGSGALDAKKYSVNFYDTTTSAVNCLTYPIWTQYLAGTFGLAFKECPGTTLQGTAAANSVSLATVGGTSGSVVTALQQYLANGTNGQPAADHDLVTVLVGQQDVLDAYAALGASPAQSAVDAAVVAIQANAQALAAQINVVAQSGPPVIVSTIPNVAITPFGRQQSAAGSAILSRLSQAYNDKLTLSLINDGHLIGLVNGETEVQNMTSTNGNPNGYGIANDNIGVAACASPATAALLNCNSNGTAVFDATANNLVQTPLASGATQLVTTYLWAGDTQLGPVAHSRLGLIAESRAKNNPF
jgi:hypothetical protein